MEFIGGGDEERQKPPVEEEVQSLRVILINLQGIGLANLDTGRDKSDCQAVLKMKWQQGQDKWFSVDHTEVIHDNLDPRWQHSFEVVYNFGQQVQLRFEINDMNADGTV